LPASAGAPTGRPTILLTLVDTRQVESVEVPRGLADANPPVLLSIVRD
jgi:hypothetical protein